ncbi:MAG: ABC transporter permease subunit [Bryobacteraceae bacterium]|nr:ABC transporter permease subunit [Bryobacteraceae bacterium]
MTRDFRARQIWTIARLELRRVFFSKRSFWVYGLALFPVAIFVAAAIGMTYERRSYEAVNRVSPALINSVNEGESVEAVLERLGTPVRDREFRRRHRGEDDESEELLVIRNLRYWDGSRFAELRFRNGILEAKFIRQLISLERQRQAYNGVFHYYYLKLAIFFGCLGIFMNLFRGEMLDKTLHFWLLAPARREVLLGGKYLAGLLASSVIFGAGAALMFAAMVWPVDPLEARAFLAGPAAAQWARYAGAAMLACLGYGSAFLAAGLLVRNPIVPAVVLLMWESINGFLPAVLQKISVLHYVQSVCPMPAPMDDGAPALVRLFLAPAPGTAWPLAVLGLCALTAAVLFVAARAVKRLEINYGGD